MPPEPWRHSAQYHALDRVAWWCLTGTAAGVGIGELCLWPVPTCWSFLVCCLALMHARAARRVVVCHAVGKVLETTAPLTHRGLETFTYVHNKVVVSDRMCK